MFHAKIYVYVHVYVYVQVIEVLDEVGGSDVTGLSYEGHRTWTDEGNLASWGWLLLLLLLGSYMYDVPTCIPVYLTRYVR